jgi:hypothetical protein
MKLTTSFAVLAGIASGVVSSLIMAHISDSKRRDASHAEMSLPPATTEEQMAAALARHEAAIVAHRKEPLDPVWSPRAQAAFTGELSALAASARCNVANVDCRSASCIADLRFKSYDDERMTFAGFLTHSYAENCRKELYGPVPEDKSAPYTATILFDCSRRLDASSP